MNIFETYGKELFALAVPIVTWLLDRYFKSKARLFTGSRHQFTYRIMQPLLDAAGVVIAPNQTATTVSMLAWNNGRETATKVEWLFNAKPAFLNVWPPRHYDERNEPDGRYTIIFDNLAPGENIQCELLAFNAEPPNLLLVRSEQCVAQTMNLQPQVWLPNWQRRIAVVLIFAGLAAVVYALIVLLQLLVLKTPTLY